VQVPSWNTKMRANGRAKCKPRFRHHHQCAEVREGTILAYQRPDSNRDDALSRLGQSGVGQKRASGRTPGPWLGLPLSVTLKLRWPIRSPSSASSLLLSFRVSFPTLFAEFPLLLFSVHEHIIGVF